MITTAMPVRLHTSGLVASKPVAFPLCHPISATLAAPRTRKLWFLLSGFGPTWFPGLKRKELSIIGSPAAQKPSFPRPLSTTYVDSDFAPIPTTQQPLSSAVGTALWSQREGEGKASQCGRSHPHSRGLFPLPPGLSELRPKPENMFLISCTFAVK